MRRRATFVHSPTLEFDPAEIQLKGRQFLHPGLKAAREERLTFGFKELPVAIVDTLQRSHEVHIRWTSENGYGFTSPFLSRSSPGLHVYYTPPEQSSDSPLCALLQEVFSHDLRCHSPSTSFTRPDVLSDRFASTASLQYYSLLASLSQFVAYIQRNICSQSDQQCIHDAALLNIVDSLDLDYDSVSHALVVTAFWLKAPPAIYDPIGGLTTLDQWPLDISSKGKNDRVEVGILSGSPANEPEELSLGGFLTVVGEDESPRATVFSFPSRHHHLLQDQASKQEYTVSFQQPTGLHPTLKISFNSANSLKPPEKKAEDSICALHAYLTLPSAIFPDQYAFTANDPLFEQSHNLRSLRSISGELGLEAPDYVIEKWGSTMLLELATPAPMAVETLDKTWNVTIPLHLRYLPPAKGGLGKIRVPWPIVFWACTADEGTRFPVNPFDRVNLGYDGVFGPRTMFYHLRPRPAPGNEGKLIETIDVPVLDPSKVGGNSVIEQVTLVAILLGFGWVLLKLWPGLRAQFSGPPPTSKESKSVGEKKKQ